MVPKLCRHTNLNLSFYYLSVQHQWLLLHLFSVKIQYNIEVELVFPFLTDRFITGLWLTLKCYQQTCDKRVSTEASNRLLHGCPNRTISVYIVLVQYIIVIYHGASAKKGSFGLHSSNQQLKQPEGILQVLTQAYC